MRDASSGPADTGKTPLRVLLFEDCAEDIELSLRALRSACFEVQADIAVTLEEVLGRVRAVRYDVILSDYRMPRTTGMECFAALKAEGVETPFILVTGSLGDEKAVECLKEGVSDYVLKDRLARLPVAIRRALAERRLRAEQTESEEALRHSEASYRSLIQNAPCGILRLDARTGRLLEANRAVAGMLGYASPADLLRNSAGGGMALDAELLDRLAGGRRQNWREHGPGQDQGNSGPRLARPEEGAFAENVGCETEWTDSQGQPILIELRGRLLREDDGAPGYFEMIAENVTARRHAENRIRQLNRLYSTLSHAGQAIVSIREPIALFREICRIVVEEGGFLMAWVGAVACGTNSVEPVASWGGDPKFLEGIGVTTAEEPAGSGAIGTAIRESRRVICNDFLADPRLALWRDRARERNYRSVSAFPLRVGSDTIGALAIYAAEKDFFDSESVALLDRLAANLSFALERIAADEMRQRAVNELDQFFLLSLDMLCIADLRGYIYRLNPAWEQTLGFSAAEMCSRPCVEFIHPGDREQALAAAAGLAAGETVQRMELRFVSKDGSYRWLTGSATPSVEHGVVFAAVSDITELKRLDEQLHSQNLALQEQNHRLNEASRMKSEFLANMSHELRSPLNGIIGFTELLQDGKLGAIPEKPRGYLGRIHKSAQHLLQLINSVLDVSKIEAGRMELYPEPVHLSSLVEEVIAIQGALAAQKTLRIETDLQPEADRVVTDAARFKQILHNYLSNALKFTNPGGRVTVRLQPEGSAEFRLEVSDTGVGIAATDIPRLFTEFQQLDLTASKRYQGTGLGLALTKRIVEAQGGRVGVRSQPGQGSTFFAVLPKGRTASDSQPTVLLVEDERAQSFALVRRLQKSGLAVEIASNAAAAVAKCRQKRFDAIILELLLPDESGYEPLAAIRSLESHRQTPVVVVSAVGPPAGAESRDIQAFLTKPVDPAELAACLERCGLLRVPKEAA